jgi:hypothetical protein
LTRAIGSGRIHFVGAEKSLCYPAQQEETTMTTDVAAIVDPELRQQAVLEVEYPVQLADTREPVLCLAGTVSVIRPGRRGLALSEAEWQDLSEAVK